eukprot:m.358865 g.358865  ORF g.358865 m.358865 type:complete len:598 (-) comp18325_c0_seq1:118-1911(-)
MDEILATELPEDDLSDVEEVAEAQLTSSPAPVTPGSVAPLSSTSLVPSSSAPASFNSACDADDDDDDEEVVDITAGIFEVNTAPVHLDAHPPQKTCHPGAEYPTPQAGKVTGATSTVAAPQSTSERAPLQPQRSAPMAPRRAPPPPPANLVRQPSLTSPSTEELKANASRRYAAAVTAQSSPPHTHAFTPPTQQLQYNQADSQIRPPRPPPPSAIARSVSSSAVTEEGEEDWSEVEKHNIINTAGTDRQGRIVVVFFACRLPPRERLSHDLLLRYMKHKMHSIVQSHYIIVYFHHGLTRSNKPSVSWIKRVFSSFDRSYKKNLQELYCVHPTGFVRTVLFCLSLFISQKFGKKIKFISKLAELRDVIQLDQMSLPPSLIEHDRKQKSSSRVAGTAGAAAARGDVFGIPLFEIRSVTPEGVPKIIDKAVCHLLETGLDVEGIFRRSASAVLVQQLKEDIDTGLPVDFSQHDAHVPAVLIKMFLRNLPEPLLTFEAYDHFVSALAMPTVQERVDATAQTLKELPERNLALCKRLFTFLKTVSENHDVNKMTVSNLSIVIGPNVLWSRVVADFGSMATVNKLTQLMIEHANELFASGVAS